MYWSERAAFVVKEEDLRRLDGIIAATGSPARYKVTAGDERLELDDLQSVLALPNSRGRPVRAIQAANDILAYNHVEVELDASADRTIRIRSGSSARGADSTPALEEWLAEVRPWYSAVATMDFVMLFLVLLVIGYVGLVVWAVITLMSRPLSEPYPPSERTRGTVLTELLAQWIWLAPLFLGWVVNRLRAPLFPIAEFAIGYGKRRHENRSFARTSVLLLGVIIPVVTTILLNRVGN